MLLNIHLLAQVRLRKHRQRVPRYPAIAHTRPDPPHKVRHRLEPARRDALQGLARLERDAVTRDLDLHRLARSRLDVQAGRGVGGRRQLFQGRQLGPREAREVRRAGHRGVDLLFVDEHGRRQARQAAVVEMRAAPVVLVALCRRRRRVGRPLGEVVQQPRLGGVGRADDVLQVALGVALDLLLGKAVAGARHQHGNVDDEAAEAGHGRLHAGEHSLRRPNVGREVLGERLGRELWRGLGTVQAGVDVEGTVCVVGSLEGVGLAILERLLAEGPASQVFGLGIFQLV